MWGKPTRHAKSKWYPAIAVVLATLVCTVSAWVVLGRLMAKTSLPPAAIDPLATPGNEATSPAEPPTAASPLPRPSPVPTPSPLVVTPAKSKENVKPFVRQGLLRISNPTEHPVRVALLARKGATESTDDAATSQPGYDTPAHWDFAPEEGGTKGLIVSLPDRKVKLKQGDILVAFAQDGSRQYWGPYVVGETPQPVWNPKAAEWELVLQP